jgi:pyruvate kinase
MMDIRTLEKELSQILLEIIDNEALINEVTSQVHQEYRLSAKNLLRYLILRSKDLRKYHGLLSDLGLSSLRSGEGYVFSNLYSVVRNINLIQNTPFKIRKSVDIIGYTRSKDIIRSHANNLFNQLQKGHFTEIMVTLPDEAAEDKELIRKMVLNGMEIARINLSHGHINQWKQMVTFIKEIEKETDQKVKIYMDLSGPKLRTSNIEIHNKKGETKDSISVSIGEHIILSKEQPALERIKTKGKKKLKSKVVKVLLDEVINDAQIGDIVLFDDGMIKSAVVDKQNDMLELVITECYKPKLGSHKGINLPNTKLNLPALTKTDISDLKFVCQYADIVGYSFVRTASDVSQLYRELRKNKADQMGVVFKIENQDAFENLPEILLKGMERNKIGVMIARGDLAVEIGFERISEVQNEILWLCEAAHIPVIWATQVLENLAKTGIPTRAEISDAALSAQAECVMLNKGPSIINAIQVLKNILVRMEGHSFKKKNELRPLNVAKQFIAGLKN